MVADFSDDKITVTHILIRNTPDLKITDLTTIFNFKTIVFDSSNKKYQVEKWKKECEDLNLQYWYTAEDGAFILTVE